MEALKIRNASAMPAPTWSWLRMNAATLEVPEGLERVRFGKLTLPDDLPLGEWRWLSGVSDVIRREK